MTITSQTVAAKWNVSWVSDTEPRRWQQDGQEKAAAHGRRLAYLTNAYPKISHSFIQTEIEALERAGFTVERFTIRRTLDVVTDPSGRAEQRRTTALFDENRAKLLLAIARLSIRRPIGTARALGHALRSACRQRVSLINLARAVAYFGEAASLADQLERLGVRHVHVHFGTNPATVARLAARMAPLTYSFTVHGPDEFDAPLALDLAGKVNEAAFVAAVSHFGRGQLMRWCDPSVWSRIHVVRCAIAPQFLTARSFGDSPRRLVCVARLSAQKGLPLLVEAAARLARERHFTLNIIGDGEQRPALEAEIMRLGLSDRIRLLGWRSPGDVLREVAGARAFVLPSFAEGLPVVLMEALALGRPVIATAIAGIPELVDSENGWLIPSGSVEALADAMQEALDAPVARLEAMGAAGRARVHAMHHPDQNAQVLAQLLTPLMS